MQAEYTDVELQKYHLTNSPNLPTHPKDRNKKKNLSIMAIENLENYLKQGHPT